jgi:uncharacterized membrane protein YqjE
MPNDAPSEQKPGLLSSLRTLMATLVAVMCTRLEIMGNEFEQERVRLARLLVLGTVSVLFAGLAMIFATVLVLLLFEDEHRIFALYTVSIVYALLAFAAGWRLRYEMRQKSQLFAVSLGELRKDQHELEP